MSFDQTPQIKMENLNGRLKDWRQDMQATIESSARQALDEHAEKLSTPSYTNSQKLEVEMNKVLETALQKVEEMQKHNMDSEKIRESILPSIQQMNSPFPSNTELNSQFKELNQKIHDRVDAQIVGNNQVFRRNHRM